MKADEQATLKEIQLYSWTILLVMTVTGWILIKDQLWAGSIAVGGLIANISFWMLKKDLTRLMQGELASVKARFFIKYYVRLAVLTIILFLIIRYGAVHILGLLAGLSTVFISIVTVAALKTRKGSNI